jgi:hypothetical protein
MPVTSTFNPLVTGSNPVRPTKRHKGSRAIGGAFSLCIRFSFCIPFVLGVLPGLVHSRALSACSKVLHSPAVKPSSLIYARGAAPNVEALANPEAGR